MGRLRSGVVLVGVPLTGAPLKFQKCIEVAGDRARGEMLLALAFVALFGGFASGGLGVARAAFGWGVFARIVSLLPLLRPGPLIEIFVRGLERVPVIRDLYGHPCAQSEVPDFRRKAILTMANVRVNCANFDRELWQEPPKLLPCFVLEDPAVTGQEILKGNPVFRARCAVGHDDVSTQRPVLNPVARGAAVDRFNNVITLDGFVGVDAGDCVVCLFHCSVLRLAFRLAIGDLRKGEEGAIEPRPS